MITLNKDIIRRKIKKIPPVRLIIISFIVMILIGACLLSLPISTKYPISFLDALFTATSATCVTGLSVFDTFSTFTWFGQGIILVLIQIGGLGLATLVTAMTLFVRKKLGFKNLLVLGESSGSDGLDLTSLLKVIICMTFTCEAIGALLLMIRFIPLYGSLGAWAAVFVAISAFCNAGFDILGFIPGNSSISSFAQDPLVCLTICALVFAGSLGFVVIHDIYTNKIKAKFLTKKTNRLNFHSQVCLRVSLLLVLVGFVIFFIFEFNNTMEGMTIIGKLTTALFQSVNTRTAGFASINIGSEAQITKLITIVLMFIGGCPGSTAGGIKVTTFLVIMATVISSFRGEDDAVFLSHRFNKRQVYKSLSIVVTSAFIILLDTMIILAFNETGGTLDTVFEAVSAFATVGLSAGLTSSLDVVGKILIILTMFVGRVGPASLGIAIMMKDKNRYNKILPEGRLLIG